MLLVLLVLNGIQTTHTTPQCRWSTATVSVCTVEGPPVLMAAANPLLTWHVEHLQSIWVTFELRTATESFHCYTLAIVCQFYHDEIIREKQRIEFSLLLVVVYENMVPKAKV